MLPKPNLQVLGFPFQFIKLHLNLRILKWICLVRRTNSLPGGSSPFSTVKEGGRRRSPESIERLVVVVVEDEEEEVMVVNPVKTICDFVAICFSFFAVLIQTPL